MSGAATGGLLAARAGLKAAGKNAAVGGVILAAIEGLQIVLARVLGPWMEKRYVVIQFPSLFLLLTNTIKKS